MNGVWRISYTESTSNGSHGWFERKVADALIVTDTADLAEIEKRKTIVRQPLDRIYQKIEITHAEFLGTCEVLFHDERPAFLKKIMD